MAKKKIIKRKKYAEGTPINGVSLGMDMAKNLSSSLIKDSKTSNVVDSALSMAGTGMAVAGPIGAGIGALLGTGTGLLQNSKTKRPEPIIEAGKAAVNTPGLSMKEGGVVKGPGGPKDDKVKTSLPEGSFVTPAENSEKAKMLRKEVLGKSVKENKTKGNVPVNLSAGEHVFTPEEKEKLIKAGVNLSALAPNAKSDTSSFSDGTTDEGVKKKEFQKAQLREYLKNPNVRAYLNGILRGEADPGSIMDGKNPKSTAYGPYQFLEGTRKEIMDKYGVDAYSDDFEEASLAAIALIKRAGGMKSVANGEFDTADQKLNKTWTSLPGGSEKNSKTDSIVQARKDSLEGKESSDLYIPKEGDLPTYKRNKPIPTKTERAPYKLGQITGDTKPGIKLKSRAPYVKGEYKQAYDEVKALADKKGIKIDWKNLSVSDVDKLKKEWGNDQEGYAEMEKALHKLRRADVMQNYDPSYKPGTLDKLKKEIESEYAPIKKETLTGSSIDWGKGTLNRGFSNKTLGTTPEDQQKIASLEEKISRYKKMEKQFEAWQYYNKENKALKQNETSDQTAINIPAPPPPDPYKTTDPDSGIDPDANDNYEAPVEPLARKTENPSLLTVPTNAPEQNLATNFQYRSPAKGPGEPPPPTENLLNKIGGIGTLLALGQTAWGT